MSNITLSIPGNEPDSLIFLGICIKRLALEVFEDEQASEVELAIIEAATNSMRHGELNGKDIQVIFTADSISVIIDLIDEGKPMDPMVLETCGTEFDYDTSDVQNLPDGGIGLMIIKNLMDEVSYRFENGSNHWRFQKHR